ncbi:uncharacterized protein L201_000380 [Kwoniella dendrophila CBS 6074]|uniref:Uncharacterized protein n=1 Tax=Kwoniella dendrophila CBS 6074 TaxID=1295534 RepID=A0AAX4JJ94_9TREE
MTTSTSSSLFPILVVGGTWYYLSSRGSVTQTIWLSLNILETLRALRVVRPNGRRIGMNTRRKAMRESLICWSVYVIFQTIGPIISTLLGWIPFYSPVKTVLTMAFLFTRLPASSHLFHHILTPLVKPYETPIDLTILLIQSIGILIFHYILQVPISFIITTCMYFKRVAVSAYLQAIVHVKSRKSTVIPKSPKRTTVISEDFRARAAFLSPPPQIPGSILLRHPSPRPPTPRRSISFLSPPATPKILPPSPPSSPESDEIQIIAGPSTPRRPSSARRENNLLNVEEIREVRKSPRRQKAVDVDNTELDNLDLTQRQDTMPEKKKPDRPRTKAVKSTKEDYSSNTIMSSGRKGKGKALPVLVIPDEDEMNFPEIQHLPPLRDHANPMVIDSISSKAGVSTVIENDGEAFQIPKKAVNSRSKIVALPTVSKLRGLSSTSTRPETNKAKPYSRIKETSKPDSKSVTALNKTNISDTNPDRNHISRKTIVKSSTTTTRTTKPTTTKLKTPRKPRILRASEGGVAHDKPISTSASRARTRARSKTAEIVTEQPTVEEVKKVGEKRRTIPAVDVEAVTKRKRVKK